MTDSNNTTDGDNDEIGDQIEGLARDLARTISAAPAEQRERLRDMAVHLLRDEVEIIKEVEAAPTAAGGVNPFAIGIPLLLAGSVTWILSPLITLLLFAAAAVMMIWGIAAVMFGRNR